MTLPASTFDQTFPAAATVFSSVQSLSRPTLCDPVDCSTPGLPAHHHLPRGCSDSCPSSLWCHPTISSSVVPLSSCPNSFPASGSFLMSPLFTSGGQSIPASASFLPVNIQDWFPFGKSPCRSLLDLLAVQGTLRSLLQHNSSKASIL